MYAIVEIAGKQYKVQEKDKLYVPHLDANVDDTIELDRVLLVADDDDVTVGTPLVASATISATVLEHVKADKVLVFRKIRRKRFKVTKGHRQRYTRIEVGDVQVNGKKAKGDTKKKADSPKPAEAKEAKAAEAKEAKAAEAKEAKAAEAKEAKAAEAKEAKAAEAPKEPEASEAPENSAEEADDGKKV